MTPKQETFIREYLIDLNATQAAIRSGYSPRTAFRIGQENMQKPAILCEIKRAMDERAKRTKITQDRVLRELAAIAFLDAATLFTAEGALLPLSEMSTDVRAVIAGLEVAETADAGGGATGRIRKVKIADKIAALTLLMRHLGMLNDKLKLQSDPENPLLMLIQSIQGTALKTVPTAALPQPVDEAHLIRS